MNTFDSSGSVACRRGIGLLKSGFCGIFALSLATAPMFAGGATASESPATTQPTAGQDDLRQEVQQLRSQLQQTQTREQALEQQVQKQSAQMSQEAGEVNQQIIQDADAHSNFMSNLSGVASFDPQSGFQLTSDDGNFRVHPFVLLQVRDDTDWRNRAKSDGADDTENGFEIRRMQWGIEGNVFSPDLTYRIFIQTDRSGGDASLFDAWVKYHFHDTPWSIEGGQFKSPFAHEQMVFDRTLLAADRTIMDDILADGEAFSQGVMAIYQTDQLRGRAQFTNGYGVNDVNYENYPARSANFGLGTRVEYKFFGTWNEYDQFTSEGNTQDLLVAGGGLDWTEADPTDYIRQAADVQYNCGPLGLYGGYIGRYTERNGAAGYTYDASTVLQASYMLDPKHWEIFGRFDYVWFNGREFAAGTNTNVYEITAGANYYFYGQNLKMTGDVVYLPNGSPIDDNGSGVLVDPGRSEVVLRLQLQLVI